MSGASNVAKQKVDCTPTSWTCLVAGHIIRVVPPNWYPICLSQIAILGQFPKNKSNISLDLSLMCLLSFAGPNISSMHAHVSPQTSLIRMMWNFRSVSMTACGRWVNRTCSVSCFLVLKRAVGSEPDDDHAALAFFVRETLAKNTWKTGLTFWALLEYDWSDSFELYITTKLSIEQSKMILGLRFGL